MGSRNYSLEITSLRKIILYKTDFATLPILHVSLADLCALLINSFGKLPLTISDTNLQPSQHLK